MEKITEEILSHFAQEIWAVLNPDIDDIEGIAPNVVVDAGEGCAGVCNEQGEVGRELLLPAAASKRVEEGRRLLSHAGRVV